MRLLWLTVMRVIGTYFYSIHIIQQCNKTNKSRAWVAQLVKHPTLGLSSDLDLRVVSLSPTLDSVLGVKPTYKKQKRKVKKEKNS